MSVMKAIMNDDKKRLKQTLEDMKEFRTGKIQFRKTYYVVIMYFIRDLVEEFGTMRVRVPINREQRIQLQQTIAGLGLLYPVKINTGY